MEQLIILNLAFLFSILLWQMLNAIQVAKLAKRIEQTMRKVERLYDDAPEAEEWKKQ